MGEEHKPTFMENVATNWAAFRLFLWNSEKKEFLGRNGKSWGQIGVFYFILYIFLAAFWALMFFIFMATVSPDHPTFDSYVNVPGLSIRPKFDNHVVEFNPEVKSSYADHVAGLKSIWDGLSPSDQTGEEYVDCSNNTTAPEGKFCRFNREVFGPCRPPNFGWDEGSPCLLLSLNRVAGWVPEDYEEGAVPEEVKDVYVPGNVALYCMNYKNKHMYSNNTIYPSAGIPSKYYPFVGTTNQEKRAKYIQPYAAVQFDFNIEDEQIKVLCKTYVANIKPLGGLYDTDYESEVVYEFILSTKSKDEL
ncbi:sodium/potassium-transporting ATPase subunit beta-1-like isoform X2 [Patiria miniata]|uniref:Sodium/potassium-transporting ATPase subunit beta n=1 Tax=Patiria miniata TaxID=46514 RepID=A0A913ZJN4_PATMI|nr:sodium/potassium-transporting ATPase subunit beta-1-like isoform X2 [Patiria miniata]